MLLTGFPPLGSSGPKGHFLATALPHGLLRQKLLGTMDSEPRMGPARRRPASTREGRQGLQGDSSDRSWVRPWHFSLPSDASRGRRLAAAMGKTWERGGGRRRGTLTKMCDFRCRRGLRAPRQPRLARVAAAETRRRRPSLLETLLGFRYTAPLAALHPSALSWARPLALRPAFRVVPAFGSAPHVIELPLGGGLFPVLKSRCPAEWRRNNLFGCCAWRASGRASGASARRQER